MKFMLNLNEMIFLEENILSKKREPFAQLLTAVLRYAGNLLHWKI